MSVRPSDPRLGALPRVLALGRSLADARGADALAVFALAALSLLLRSRNLDAGFWIDEGLSVGIASHPVGEIPELLRRDGSPPLYYLLLHGWMEVAGSSEAATHALSLVFALLCIPAAYWVGRSVAGRRAGLVFAALAASIPFLTGYAQETRMYTLVALLSVLATGAFIHAFVGRRRVFVPAFGVLLALLLYTHGWGIFFALGALGAAIVLAQRSPTPRLVALDAAAAFGGAAVLFAPWVPTLLYQAQHTGAPWSSPPSAAGVLGALSGLLSGDGAAIALLLAGGSGLAAVLRHRYPERRAVLAAAAVALVTLASGWVASQVSPAWANRYLAVLLGPLLLVAAVGLARAGRLGLVALLLVLLFWLPYSPGDDKSNVRELAARVASLVRPGDLVVSTQPEQTAVLAYYLPGGLRWASSSGLVSDPAVMDWRNAVARLEAADPAATAGSLIDSLEPGARLLLVRPVVENPDSWDAPWTELVRDRSHEWRDVVRADPRLERVARARPDLDATFKPLQVEVFERRAGAPFPDVGSG
jgi:hypothetical protein